MNDVITIGSAVRDAFLVSKAFKIIGDQKSSTAGWECVPLGSKIDLDNFILTCGGGGMNSAVTFASLGFQVASICRIGNDSVGKDILNEMKRRKIKTLYVEKVKDQQTGFSALLTAPDGERTVLTHRGASATFDGTEIKINSLKAKWFYITSLAGNINIVSKIAKHAERIGANTAYNPGASEIKKGLENLLPIFRHITVLNINLEEAQTLIKNKTTDFAKIGKILASEGQTVIITNGKYGAYAYKDGELWFVRTQNVPTISSTGAGDGFGSAFVAALIRGLDTQDALRVAMINAQSIIQSYGAQIGIIKNFPTKNAMKEIKVRKII
ncbi:carbohydrate kinase family protein [Patescibacteria group bacterium]|nr:carbohydrate kinase family protein [Patescibacteria group bacterium]